MKLFESHARVLENREVKPGYYTMSLDCEDIACAAAPGQFIMLGAGDSLHPLLRRPFSVNDVREGEGGVEILTILYMVVGRGTKILSGKKPGDRVQVLGPLGRGFVFDPEIEHSCLVAGGIGVAPMVFLARYLSQDTSSGSCRLILGARSKEHILCEDVFEKLGVEVLAATEDGSLGRKGLVTDLLGDVLNESPPVQIFACGPMPMLKAVGMTARRFEKPCQVSVEAAMACGMGACLGCALPRSDGNGKYLHACTEGPVFDSSLLWKQEE